MSAEEGFDKEAWFEKFLACKTDEDMTKMIMEYPLTEEEIRRASLMAPEDLEYCYMAVRRE